MNQEAPVGTTLAIMERAMKVQSAIQARIHASLKQEYKILSEIIRDYTDPEYPYETDEGESIKVEDFDDRIDVVPVSDPNASSMAQRIMQYQAALQLAAQAPNLYDMPLLHRQMMELIGIPNADKVVPDTDEVPPKDPVSENQDILTMSPVKAYEYQDHDAHMRVHMVLKSDPQMAQEVQNSPAGGAVMGALDAHVREHLAFIFRRQIEEELGVPMPPVGQPLPEDVEKRLSSLVAEAADQMTGKKQQQQQAQQQAEQQQDPIIQQRERELGIQESEVQRKQQADAAKQQIQQQKMAADQQQDAAELELEREKLALDETELMIKTQIDREQFEALQEAEGYKHEVDQKERKADREDKRGKEFIEQQERESDREVDGYKTAVELEQREKDRKPTGE